MPDAGLTHIAIEVADLQRSIDFYAAYGGFEVVHRRDGIAWISDRTRPFALVLAARDEVHPVGPFAHLDSRAAIDANSTPRGTGPGGGRLRLGPHGDDGPAGTWAFLDDPDGNTFELSLGQSVAVAVPTANGPRTPVDWRSSASWGTRACDAGTGRPARACLAGPAGISSPAVASGS